MIKLGWFSTGGGEGSLGLLRDVQGAIISGDLNSNIKFVFCNRDYGESEGTDQFIRQVKQFGIPLVTLSSRDFRIKHGGGSFSTHRSAYDMQVMDMLRAYDVDMCLLAGYMLIVDIKTCRRYKMLNLHPALPGGPVGTWQNVIWQLIEGRHAQTGSYVHLVTEDLDRGPVMTYCSFSIRGEEFEPLWQQIHGLSLEDIKSLHGEDLPLFQLIRHYSVKMERPLVLETLKLVSNGNLVIDGGQILDQAGKSIQPVCLNDAIERYMS